MTVPPSRGQRRSASTPPPEGRFTTTTGQVEWVRERDDGAWTLYVNGVPSSPLRAGAPEVLDFEYLQWMADCVRLALPPGGSGGAGGGAPLRAVHLGGGACALPRHLAAVRAGVGGTRQVVVELDAELVARVREWVDLPRAPELRVQAGDARAGLAARRDASADLVVRDVFAGDATPRHVVTAEFTADVARVLDPARGLYLANAVDRTSPVGLKAEVATLLAVFPHVAAALEPGVLRGRRHGNAVLLASRAPLPLAELTRALGAGAAVARVLHGDALAALVAGAAVVHDPPVTPPGGAPASP